MKTIFLQFQLRIMDMSNEHNFFLLPSLFCLKGGKNQQIFFQLEFKFNFILSLFCSFYFSFSSFLHPSSSQRSIRFGDSANEFEMVAVKYVKDFECVINGAHIQIVMYSVQCTADSILIQLVPI